MTRARYNTELLDEVLRLTLRCQHDSPSEDDCARLNVLLAEEAEAREIYLIACDDTTTLIKLALAQEPTPSCRALLGPTVRGLLALAVAASLLLFAGWSAWPSHVGTHVVAVPGPAQAETAGQIVSLANVKWTPDAEAFHEWSRFSVGQSIRIEAGVVELILDNSTEIILKGPADFHLMSLDHSVLNHGNLVARCGPEAVGFKVVSPDVKVVDLGTEFGVSVQKEKHTDVVVYDGEVDLSSLSEANPLERRLTAGEALHIAHQDGKSERITEVRGDQHLTPQFPLDRRVGSSRRISSVSDNLRTSDTAKYYRVIGRGFGEDCRAYVDRPYEWNGVDETGLPPALVGGDYIMTYNDDKIRKVEIKIVLARPSTLYVMLDSRVTPPEWIKKDFLDTGHVVGLDESNPLLRHDSPHLGPGQTYESALNTDVGPGRSVDTVCSVWRRDYPVASTVKLGPIRQQSLDVRPKAVQQSMYGVVVTRLVEPNRGGVRF